MQASGSEIQLLLSVLAFGAFTGVITVRLIAGPRFHGALLFAAEAAAIACAVNAVWLLLRNRAPETGPVPLGEMLERSGEQGRAEELYRQQEILLDSVADGICGVDRQGLVSFANPAAARA